MSNSATSTNISGRVLDVLRVIQICDSNFPIGSFNHSYGMETYLRNSKVTNTDTLREYLNVFMNSVFIYSDGLAVRMLYDYLKTGSMDGVWQLDRLVTVQTVARETRNGSKLVAGRMLHLFLELYDSELLKSYDDRIRAGNAFGHPAIVFGLLMYTLGYTEEEAINFHMYSTLSTLIQNAVRAIPLGQRDGQLILKETGEGFGKLYEKIKELDYSCLGASTPGIEISQINHEILEFRLFMS